jgi:hypothetical protein
MAYDIFADYMVYLKAAIISGKIGPKAGNGARGVS